MVNDNSAITATTSMSNGKEDANYNFCFKAVFCDASVVLTNFLITFGTCSVQRLSRQRHHINYWVDLQTCALVIMAPRILMFLQRVGERMNETGETECDQR